MCQEKSEEVLKGSPVQSPGGSKRPLQRPHLIGEVLNLGLQIVDKVLLPLPESALLSPE